MPEINIEMLDVEFFRRWADVKEKKAVAENATGIADRMGAILFVESHWTQQKIADSLNVSQTWVNFQLRFGRFIFFITTVIKNLSLTERAFRGHWDATDQYQSEEARFRAVCIALGIEPPPVVAPVPIASNMPRWRSLLNLTPEDGLDTAIDALLTKLEMVPGSKRHLAKWLLTRGHDHVICMVIERQGVPLEPAARYVSSVTQARQAEVTAAEVAQIGRSLMPGNKNKSAGGTTAARSRAAAPPTPIARGRSAPTAPASAPVNFSRLDIGSEIIPGQPVQLQPAHAQRLMEASIRVNSGVVPLVQSIADLDLTGFVEDVEKLSTAQGDYARTIRRSLEQLDRTIDTAITKLEELKTLRGRMTGQIEPQPVEPQPVSPSVH
jgi:hypothetical protein